MWTGSKSVLRYKSLSLWGSIASGGNESNERGSFFFLKGWLSCCGGKGRDFHFWLDEWVGVGPLCSRYPRVFRVVSNKDSSVCES